MIDLELRQLIKKEGAVMRQAHLTRPRIRSRREDTYSYWEIENRALFLYVGGCEIYRESSSGVFETGVLYGRFDTVAVSAVTLLYLQWIYSALDAKTNILLIG